jgi:radical SAM superfamily enzyme YgiQ (UPF0313 family)
LILLLSTYELGRPPASTARMAAHLAAAGLEARAVDLSRRELDAALLDAASLVVVATPMHTALRLGLELLPRLRDKAVCFAGHYAALHAGHLRELGVDAVLGGELEADLLELARAVEAGEPLDRTESVSLRRLPVVAPTRAAIDLADYAHYVDADDQHHLAGYVEATRGCLDRCRHCPIPPVYGGRFVAVDRAEVLAAIAHQVDAGAEHISFGDPDFLNGPTHSLRVCRELHRRWPALTFDFTAQVSHILDRRDAVAELVELGATFAVTAVESLSDRVLEAIAKRHRRADVDELLDWADGAGLALRPTLLPFTPWTELADLVELTDWISARRLEHAVDPVQFSVRLLVPPRSLLLEAHPETFGPFEPALLGHRWTSPLDPLARRIAAIAEAAAEARSDDVATHAAIRSAVRSTAELPEPPGLHAPPPRVPRVSEPWFC